ncbi:MAG: hypothetical protein U0T11_03360 [Chitinophagaceae bacterium]
MKLRYFLLSLTILLLLSCTDHKKNEVEKKEPPQALKDKPDSYELISKRFSGDDLVEELYAELVSQNADLKQLEKTIDSLKSEQSELKLAFNTFDGKNKNYYETANNHIQKIKDSVLANKVKQLITNSLKKYNASVKLNNELLSTIENKTLTINDLHVVIKIMKTLPLIEQYQKESKPDPNLLKEFIKTQEKLITVGEKTAGGL